MVYALIYSPVTGYLYLTVFNFHQTILQVDKSYLIVGMNIQYLTNV